MKYLITGLGNIGPEYENTRHNIGFNVLDAFQASNVVYTPMRYGSVAETRFKGRTLILLKPSTYMNLSGNAVHYWLKKENILLEHLLVIVDDLALPLGTLRLRPGGSHGGHNGLNHIETVLGTSSYARLRFGIGNGFRRGGQIDYVLGRWSKEESEQLPPLIERSCSIIESFVTQGLQRTMNLYNTAKPNTEV